MAAPSARMASRPLLQFLTCVGRTGAVDTGFRRFSVSYVCGASLQSKVVRESVCSPWKLQAAACLQRLPVVSQDLSPTELHVSHMMQQIELEKSLLCDHELRLLEDAERMSRKQADDYDSDEEEEHGNQEIVLTQDLEDSWEQRLKQFQPAPRVRADVERNLSSVERCLADPLVLLAEHEVDGEKMWLLPQTQWQEGESLSQTAQRALASLPAAGLQATFLGHAPCGVYKYKLPKAARTESFVGVKTFFFKAVLSGGSLPPAPNARCLWVKKSELQDYLKPAYLEKVERFILSL
ncbi:large ribosomal subunit protein mL46 isoform 1-T2 [Polymixia lowei]